MICEAPLASHFQQLAGRGGEPADDSSEAYVSEYQSGDHLA